MASVASAASFLKQQQTLFDPLTLEAVFNAHGHRWRRRELPPATTIKLYVRQIVAGNVACAEVRALREGAFTASAYCQARCRLPVAAVWELTRSITAGLRQSLPQANRRHCWPRTSTPSR